jgi:hypothetical protein
VGPISLPMPLVGPAPVKAVKGEPMALYQTPTIPSVPTHTEAEELSGVQEDFSATEGTIIKQEHDITNMAGVPPLESAATPASKKSSAPPRHSVCSTDKSFWVQPAAYESADLNYEANIVGTILSRIGERPGKPARPGVNPFLLYTKARWDECKQHCETHNPAAAGRNDIRTTLGKWWRSASDAEKEPYNMQAQAAQEVADGVRKEWEKKAQEWDDEARKIRREYVESHPLPMSSSSGQRAGGDGSVGVSKRKTNVSNCVVLDHA